MFVSLWILVPLALLACLGAISAVFLLAHFTVRDDAAFVCIPVPPNSTDREILDLVLSYEGSVLNTRMSTLPATPPG